MHQHLAGLGEPCMVDVCRLVPMFPRRRRGHQPKVIFDESIDLATLKLPPMLVDAPAPCNCPRIKPSDDPLAIGTSQEPRLIPICLMNPWKGSKGSMTIDGIQSQRCDQRAIDSLTKLPEIKRYSSCRWNIGVGKSLRYCRDLPTTCSTVQSQRCAARGARPL
jgi:hypothetical protein